MFCVLVPPHTIQFESPEVTRAEADILEAPTITTATQSAAAEKSAQAKTPPAATNEPAKPSSSADGKHIACRNVIILTFAFTQLHVVVISHYNIFCNLQVLQQNQRRKISSSLTSS